MFRVSLSIFGSPDQLPPPPLFVHGCVSVLTIDAYTETTGSVVDTRHARRTGLYKFRNSCVFLVLLRIISFLSTQ